MELDKDYKMYRVNALAYWIGLNVCYVFFLVLWDVFPSAACPVVDTGAGLWLVTTVHQILVLSS